ncbi:DUF7139 domain-containing protein [Natrarchaeobius chitinivorans]|uniref:Permease n=1 Tax=Natrarchaeobius chitinivorans TaxID=1679083 RepID=A0A3N6M132_NATCH|nr:permease [Natrarchaeobius chitinivorans]RQG97013.1 permease [Natrarchaeobius chitinivorans]
MAAEPLGNGYLFDLYRRYIGEPEDRTDVYLGFGLFLGGIGLAVVALVLFLWSSTIEGGSPSYQWAEPAYALVLVSLPVTMLGIVVLLPSERRVLYTSIAGVAITLGATAGFVYAYPADWYFHGEDYTVQVVVTYAVGLAAISASTGTALIAHYLDMARAADRVDLENEDDSDADTESYSDEEIQADIDEAMEDVELSWGGVEKTEHSRLNFSGNEFDDVDVDVQAKTTRSSGVDDQVAGLKGLKGGETKTTTSSSTVDDQTAKLKQLREQKQAEETASAAGESDSLLSTVVDRFRSAFGRD